MFSWLITFQSMAMPSSLKKIPVIGHGTGTITATPAALAVVRHRCYSPASLTFSVGNNPVKGIGKRSYGTIRCSGLTLELKTTLDKVVTSHKVILFMKGTKDFPQCGFSNTVVQILKSLNVPFETINILENEILRQGLKMYSNWPTFPQLYIDGEFFGGCDIAVEAYKNGELQEVLEKAILS